MRDFIQIPTCTSERPGGDSLATGRIIKRQDGVFTFPYRPSQSPARVTCGAALLKEKLIGRNGHYGRDGLNGR